MELDVLYEDNHLLAVHQTGGFAGPGRPQRRSDPAGRSRAAYLKDKYAKPGKVYLGLVHRLDRNVSGVVLLARTSKAAGRLSSQFRDGTVTKDLPGRGGRMPGPGQRRIAQLAGRQGRRAGRDPGGNEAFSRSQGEPAALPCDGILGTGGPWWKSGR